MKLPEGFNVWLRSKLDGKIIWVHLRSAVDMRWILYWYVSSRSHQHKKWALTDCSASSGKMKVGSAGLE